MKRTRVYDFIADICNPCPVCGKQPKIYRDFEYERGWLGSWCAIECKPFLRKSHFKVECKNDTWAWALLDAYDEWNDKTA